ncbi:hypothetical protein FRC06_003282 [Ceratobasidium sp. 370]|nr:hypothetical protein FRC06_003282 [Ceratobasidium sp. 370]
MKHGIAFRKLSRTSSHRGLLLRNLVSALLQHEQIKTTVPKAKETARLAEKVGTARHSTPTLTRPRSSPSPNKTPSKPANRPKRSSSQNPHSLLPKLFSTYKTRYASRPGGYTRIHKFGHRQGDHAPHAILELVDGPRDLRFQLAARAVGRETAAGFVTGEDRALRARTKLAVEKALRFRGEQGREELERLATKHASTLVAEPRAHSGLRDFSAAPSTENGTRRLRAGERLTGMSTSATGLGLAKGALGRKPAPRVPYFWQKGWRQKAGVPAPTPQ